MTNILITAFITFFAFGFIFIWLIPPRPPGTSVVANILISAIMAALAALLGVAVLVAIPYLIMAIR